MWRFFWILIVLFASVWLGIKIAEDPGYAFFTYRNWSLETPLWFALLVLFLVLFLVYILVHFFENIDFSIYRLKNWLYYRRKYKSYSKTNRGLIELIEGNYKGAEYYLLNGVDKSDAPLINYLAAAYAAQEQKSYDRRDKYLQKAHQVSQQADIAIGLTQAKMQIEQNQLEQALATLGHLQTLAPKNRQVLKLLERVYVQLADWQSLLKLLPKLRKLKIINDKENDLFEKNIYLEILRVYITKNPENYVDLQKFWSALPKKSQKEPELIALYVKSLLPYKEAASELEEITSKTLKKTWNEELVRLYGLILADSKKQLAEAEGWKKQYGSQQILLLTLGRLCKRCQLWGKARGYLEEAIERIPNPEVYFEYGELLERLGERDTAGKVFRAGVAEFIVEH